MSEEINQDVAADPKSEHATPGGQPGDHTPADNGGVETVLETPGGTTVSETPSE